MTRRLRIIMGEERGATARHAKSLLTAIDKYEMSHPLRAHPRGVAHHTTHYPLRCDDCGSTYWSRDEYGSHVGCSGKPKGFSAGFQQ